MVSQKNPSVAGAHAFPESFIQKQIRKLNDLRDGDRAVDELICLGEQAVGHLREFLINGPPSHIYQPRQRAVRALARLGARQVLVEYLLMPKDIPDPITRFGEEAVENTAARALGAWRTEDVFEALMQLAQRRVLQGVIETLGLFQRSESIVLFVLALGDDFARGAAEHSLRSMGSRARPALLEAIRQPEPSFQDEAPSSSLRRKSAVRILAAMEWTPDQWPAISAILGDDDPEIFIPVCEIALRVAEPDVKDMAVTRLINNISRTRRQEHQEIEDILVKHFDVAQRQIMDKIAELSSNPNTSSFLDPTLEALLLICKREMVARGRLQRPK